MRFLDQHLQNQLIDNYRKANKRLILLDYDGTLVPFKPDPKEAMPGQRLINLLGNLNTDENNLFIVSGRNRSWLDKCFGNININMIAEHGALIKRKDSEWTRDVKATNEWKEDVKKIMELYVQQCNNTFVEEKEFSIVWHYRNAIPEEANVQAAALYSELNKITGNKNYKVFSGHKIVEVKNSGISKGNALKKILTAGTYDFILAIGDDYTDEDMFQVLNSVPDSYTIRVGNTASLAMFNTISPDMVISFLESMCSL